MRKGFIALTLCLSMIIIHVPGISIEAGQVHGVSKDAIKLGMISDMTGPAAHIGNKANMATEVFFRNVNNAGGINGRKVKVFYEDSAHQTTKAIAAAKYLIARRDIFAFLNVIGTSPALTVLPLVTEEKIPLITYNVSSRMFRPFNRYVFNIWTCEFDQAVIAVDYIVKDLKPRDPRIAIIYPFDEYGREGLDAFQKATKYYGLKLVAAEPYKRGDIDFSSQIVRMKKTGANYVYQPCVSLGPIMVQSHQLGFTPQFIGDVCSFSPKIIDIAGKAAKGLLVVHDKATWDENVPGIVNLKEITNKYKPDIIKGIDYYYLWAWVNANILAEGVKRAGHDLTRESLVDALETLKDFQTGGLTPPITYTKTSRKGTSYARLARADLKMRTFIPVTDFRKPSLKQE